MARFYFAVVQAVLLYNAESWTIAKRDWSSLRSFHNQVIISIKKCVQGIEERIDGTNSYRFHIKTLNNYIFKSHAKSLNASKGRNVIVEECLASVKKSLEIQQYNEHRPKLDVTTNGAFY